MAEITVKINEDEIAQMVVEKIADRMAKEYTSEFRDTKHGIRYGAEKAVKEYVYSQKDAIIEKCVARASAELVRKGLPKLIDRMEADR